MTYEAMPSQFWQGIEQFNRREFYECHDTLEALWMEAVEPNKTFYQGILQIAVGIYHLSNNNWRGAVILLGEGMNRLRRYQPDYATVDVEQLLLESAAMLKVLQATDPANSEAVMQLSNQLEASPGIPDEPPKLTVPYILKIESA